MSDLKNALAGLVQQGEAAKQTIERLERVDKLLAEPNPSVEDLREAVATLEAAGDMAAASRLKVHWIETLARRVRP